MRKTNPFEIVFVSLMLVFAAAIFGPMVFRARETRHHTDCPSNLRQLGLALSQYSQDFDERYPWHVGAGDPDNAWLDLGLLFPNYNSAFKTFYCPQSRDRVGWDSAKIADKISRPLEPFTSTGTTEVISYSYGVDARTDAPTGWTEGAPLTVCLLADKKAAVRADERSSHKDDGRNVLYNDGHVKWKASPGALDPDERHDEIGTPGARSYRRWWSDPPYYGE
ncbi:MAG: DUF1559 domain-containing protein [Verrucomicrobia bacterium]|nr:DUF1559 domain-containing protein [Verrucomicrobiota bacterium]